MPKKMLSVNDVEMKGIFQLIKASDGSLDRYAKELDVTTPTLRKWIREGTMPSMQAHKLAGLFEIPVDALYKPLLENSPFS